MFLCLVSTSFGFAENAIPRASEIFGNEPEIQNGFPNGFRPIVNVFKKIFGIKSKEIVEYNTNVTNLTLSRSELFAGCETNQNFCSNDMRIGIYTEVSNPAGDVITYVYNVSGGKISGRGEKVIWDLSDFPPGTYTITAGVDDSCGVCGQTQTKTITVVECPDCK